MAAAGVERNALTAHISVVVSNARLLFVAQKVTPLSFSPQGEVKAGSDSAPRRGFQSKE
jgi:hypothetical protein